jgi:uncharacterized membrane protein
MNPFDLKTALLAKHAQHVVVIHFPIALFMVSALFDLVVRQNTFYDETCRASSTAQPE